MGHALAVQVCGFAAPTAPGLGQWSSAVAWIGFQRVKFKFGYWGTVEQRALLGGATSRCVQWPPGAPGSKPSTPAHERERVAAAPRSRPRKRTP